MRLRGANVRVGVQLLEVDAAIDAGSRSLLAVVRTATLCFRLVGKSEGAQYTISLVNPLAVTWNVLAGTSWKSLGSEAPWQRYSQIVASAAKEPRRSGNCSSIGSKPSARSEQLRHLIFGSGSSGA